MNEFNKQAPKLEAKQLMAARLLSLTPLLKLPPKLFRPLFLSMDRMLGLSKIEMNRVVDFAIPVHTDLGDNSISRDDTTITIRCYYPTAKNTQKTLVYFHGGGCVIGSIQTHDHFCRYLAKYGEMTIISVDYRLAPEHKFPTPINDAIDAWNYIHNNHQQLNIDPKHIGVGGDSAGGYLACILGLKSLQASLPVQTKTKPLFQFLLYPMVDLQGLTESYRSFTKHLMLTRDLMDYFRMHYLSPLDDAAQPLVSLLQTKDLSESPDTYLLTLGYDPLRDDGIMYAQRLEKAGVKTHHQHYDDCMHSFISVTKLSQRAKQATHNLAMALKRFND